MHNTILEMKNISKSFPGVKALDNVSFSAERGEVHCLIGANGAGKSTLMKILAGAYDKDEGSVVFDGKELKGGSTTETRKCGLAVIYQELSLVNDLTVTENIFLNNMPRKLGRIDWNTAHKKAEELIESLNLKIDVKSHAGDLSIGSRQLVELMKCLSLNAKLIVMDEPSATLSKNEFETLLKIIADLKAKGITIIYISHRLEELFMAGDRVTVLRDGKNVTTCEINSITQDELVEFMIGHKIEARINKSSESESDKEVVLEAKGICTSVIKDLSVTLHKGEIIGLYGLVGAGRTEFLRAIYGADKITKGTLNINGVKMKPKSPRHSIKNGIGMLPENRKMQGLVLCLPVWENMVMVASKKFRGPVGLNYKKIVDSSRKYIKELGIKTPGEKTLVESLSGGNQQKVVLTKWLLQESKILLVDEPTQGIDVGAKEEIYKILRSLADKGNSLIIASSELEELLGVCDRIITMYRGVMVADFDKNELQEQAILRFAVAGR